MSSGRNRDERKRSRAQIGTLRDNTVATKTRQRYNKALTTFYSFCYVRRLRIPDAPNALAELVCDFIEFVWESGDSLSLVTDSLSGLQDLKPRLRGQLSASWRLVKTWQKLEIPHRAPPFPEDLLHTLCGFFILEGDRHMSLILETGFYAVLRTGELLSLKARDVQISPHFDCAVLSLGYTKTSQRTGAADSVTVRVTSLCRRLAAWKSNAQPDDKLVPFSDYLFRKSFDTALDKLSMKSWGFRPYSLRRGGATMYEWIGSV